MGNRTGQPALLALLIALMTTAPAVALTIRVDYSYDTTNFFGSGNPQGATAGAQARAALEAAAGFFSTILSDSFSSISSPPKFSSAVFDGMVTWQWTMNFNHPSTENPIVLTNQFVPADEYVLFVGARNIAGNTLGVGGPGGFGWSSNPMGSFTSSEITQINQITSSFQAAVERRNESSGFARWGGTISFDNAPPSPWHYNHTTSPSGSVTDFYSVALHETGHALGLGTSADWQSWVSGLSFFGPNARTEFGGNPVPLADAGHWANGTMSTVYGGSASQEVAMDPSLTTGTRKHFTDLDAAAMLDIGWSVVPLPGVHGDYNNDGKVNAADYVVWRKRLGQNVTIPNDATPGSVTASDYTVWRNNFGKTPLGGAGSAALASAAPEPASAALALLAILAISANHRSRRR